MFQAFIVSAVRTAGGKRNGRLRDWHPASMGARVLEAVVDRSGIDPNVIEDVIMGCVTQAGEQAFQVGRNSIMASRLPDKIPAVTIDRQCGSSQQAVQFAAQAIMSGTQDVVIAAGVESMTRVPMGLAMSLPLQQGIGTGPYPQSVFDRYNTTEITQFAGAEAIARKYGLTKEDLDVFGFESQKRAISATQRGAFTQEILPLEVSGPDGTTELHTVDEGIRFDATLEAIRNVKLINPNGGMLTAASSSQICDGASAVLIVSERALKEYGLTPLARIHSFGVTAGDPIIMLEEPIPATLHVLKKAGLKIDDIDLYEVNEAFASVPLAWLKTLGADPAKLNVNGGAIALGHPLGASGTKLMATLIYALKARGKRYGLQTMCEGGGIANVTILENL